VKGENMSAKGLCLSVLWVVVLANGVAVSQAASIGLNFVDGRNGSGPEALTAGQSAGVIAQTNWNNTTANTLVDGLHGTKTTSSIASPVAGAIVDSTGATTGVTASWTGYTTWSAPDEGAPNANDILMSDFLLTETSVGPDASVTFNNLTYGTYDVYVYFSGGSGGSGQTGEIKLNALAPVTVTSQAFSGGPFNEATGALDAGHYVRFAAVSGNSFTVSLNNTFTGNHMGIFGVQIVDTTVPEPATISLWAMLGVAVVGVGIWRRRRAVRGQ
jgi:hypothetical protein